MHEELTDDKRRVSMSRLMTAEQPNTKGIVHAGVILKMIDEVAVACASRWCGTPTVAVSLDHITFKYPIRIGHLVTFLAMVNFTGESTMEIGIKVVTENISMGKQFTSTNAFFNMMAVDEGGKPVKVPQLPQETESDRNRHELARLRHQLRKEMESKTEELHKLMMF